MNDRGSLRMDDRWWPTARSAGARQPVTSSFLVAENEATRANYVLRKPKVAVDKQDESYSMVLASYPPSYACNCGDISFVSSAIETKGQPSD